MYPLSNISLRATVPYYIHMYVHTSYVHTCIHNHSIKLLCHGMSYYVVQYYTYLDDHDFCSHSMVNSGIVTSL